MTTDARLHQCYVDYVERLVTDPTTDAIGHILAQRLWSFAVRLNEESHGRAIDKVAGPAKLYQLKDRPDGALGSSSSAVTATPGDDDGCAR